MTETEKDQLTGLLDKLAEEVENDTEVLTDHGKANLTKNIIAIQEYLGG